VIEIAGFPIRLPEALSQYGNLTVSLLLTIAFWLVVLIGLHYLYNYIGKPLARRTVPDIDDTILAVLRFPVLLIVAVIAAANVIRMLDLPRGLDQALVHVRDASIAMLGVMLVWRFFREVVLYYGHIYAARSETKLDDILLPIVQQVGRIVIVITGVYLVLRYLGIDLAGLWVALGGAAFILAFALQDILSNIFSGMSLIIDTPFKYGDLIELSDGKTCRVERIGVRSTQLYDIADNTIIYMPNSSLANERLLNITRPNTDLRVRIDVSAENDRDPEDLIAALESVAESHPNVLSPIPRKIELLRQRLNATYRASCRPQQGAILDPKKWAKVHEYVEELVRLREEHELNQELSHLEEQLELLALHVDEIEAGGLNRKEKAQIRNALDAAMTQHRRIARQTSRWLLSVRYVMARRLHYDVEVYEPLEAITERAEGYLAHVDRKIGNEIPMLGTMKIGRSNDREVRQAVQRYVQRAGVEGFDTGFRDIDIRYEFEAMVLGWNRRVKMLERRIQSLYEELESGNEQRVDDRVREVEDWLHTDFKETTPDWKYPEVSFVKFGDDMLDFKLQFQIDDISREHLNRRSRVETELRREIWELLANHQAPGAARAG
jgi:MscS family membrane protein